MSDSRFHDSAGVPWQGRSFEQNPWSNDDGEADAEYLKLVARFKASEIGLEQVVAAISGLRLLTPLLANLGEAELGPHGQLVDKSADLSIVSVAAPDGSSALPAFTSVAAMHQWNSESRPVPVAAEKLMLAAAAEGNKYVVLDPGSENQLVLRRPVIAAIAQGQRWLSPDKNPEVDQIVADATSGLVEKYKLVFGDVLADLSKPELIVYLGVSPGLDRPELDRIILKTSSALATERFRQLVDSVELKLVLS